MKAPLGWLGPAALAAGLLLAACGGSPGSSSAPATSATPAHSAQATPATPKTSAPATHRATRPATPKTSAPTTNGAISCTMSPGLDVLVALNGPPISVAGDSAASCRWSNNDVTLQVATDPADQSSSNTLGPSPCPGVPDGTLTGNNLPPSPISYIAAECDSGGHRYGVYLTLSPTDTGTLTSRQQAAVVTIIQKVTHTG